MLENSFKNLLGKTFIISHFLLILLVFGCRLAGKFGDSATKAALAILVPLLMTYATAVIIDIICHERKTTRRKKVSRIVTFHALCVPALFILFIAAIITKQAFAPDRLENFTVFLSLGESTFSVYLGFTFRVLFTPQLPPSV